MGILDTILGGLLGGNSNAGPLQSILNSILGGGSEPPRGGDVSGGIGGGLGGGLGGLLEQFQRAGHGEVANSWVGNGPNQPIDPGALRDVFGQHQVDQWSQQSGLPQGDLLSQLSNLIPHAVNHMTPDGQVPAASSATGSPFDEGGIELPPSR